LSNPPPWSKGREWFPAAGISRKIIYGKALPAQNETRQNHC
jgi:hypothetical protein